MASGGALKNFSSEQPAVSKFIKLQIVIALVAFILCVVTAVSLVPLFKEKAKLQQQVSDLQSQLRETANLLRNAHPVDMMDMKMIYSLHSRQAVVLESILTLQRHNVRWNLGGTSPEKGFDSPSFAVYVLEQ